HTRRRRRRLSSRLLGGAGAPSDHRGESHRERHAPGHAPPRRGRRSAACRKRPAGAEPGRGPRPRAARARQPEAGRYGQLIGMKLYAIGDLHLRHEVTRRALLELRPHPYDWLILAGDVGETEEHLRFALLVLSQRFARLLWVPGNHDLWTIPARPGELRGEEKYQLLVEICREFGVLTPEDPYVTWP